MSQQGARNRMDGQSMASASTLERSALGWTRASALGIAIAISGNFAGWNYGLAVGGWEGMLIAALAMAVMFFVLAQCLAELSALFPGGAGFDHYVREGFGPVAGYICGLSLVTALVIGTGLGASFSAAYLQSLVGMGGWPIKLGMFALIIGLQLRGAREVAGLTVLTGAVVVTVLVVFYLFAAPHFRVSNLVGSSAATAHLSPASILGCVPFALFLFLGVEQSAQAAAETDDPSRTIPKALGVAVLVATALGLATLLFATASAGVGRLGTSNDPLFTAIMAHPRVPGASVMTDIVSIGALVALMGTFFSLAYAASRQIFHFARAGDLPAALAVTNSRHAPWGALAVTGGCGVISAAFRPDTVMLVFIFLVSISYVFVLGAFMKLRYARPGLPRPYRAVGGSVMAVVGMLLALTVAASCYRLRPSILTWCLVGLGLSTAYFIVRSLRRARANPGA